MERKNLHFETLQIHVGQEQADPATDARSVPIYLSLIHLSEPTRLLILSYAAFRLKKNTNPIIIMKKKNITNTSHI